MPKIYQYILLLSSGFLLFFSSPARANRNDWLLRLTHQDPSTWLMHQKPIKENVVKAKMVTWEEDLRKWRSHETSSLEKESLTKGDYPRFYKEAQDVFKKIGQQSPPFHETASRLAILLAQTARAVGKLEEQLKWGMRALQHARKAYTFPHRFLLKRLEDVSYMHEALDQEQKALFYWSEAFMLYKQLEEDRYSSLPSYPLYMDRFAALYHALGDYSNALSFAQKALTWRESPKHFARLDELAISYNNVASLHRKLKHHDEMLFYTKKALSTYRDFCHEENDRELGMLIYERGLAYDAIRHSHEALSFFKQAMRMLEKVCEKEGITYDLEWALCLLQVAYGYKKTGKPRLGLSYGQRGLTMLKEYYRNQPHPDLIQHMHNIAQIYERILDHQKAFNLHKEAHDMATLWYKNRNHHLLASSWNHMGNGYRLLGYHEQAIECYKKACEIALYLSKLHKNSPSASLALYYNNLALSYSTHGQLREAIKYQRKAVHVAQKVIEQDVSDDLALYYNNLSGILEKQGRYEEAWSEQEKSIEMYETLYEDEKHPDLGTAYNNAAHTLLLWNKPEKALYYALKALNIARYCFKGSHPKLVGTLTTLSSCYQALGRMDKVAIYANEIEKLAKKLPRYHGKILGVE